MRKIVAIIFICLISVFLMTPSTEATTKSYAWNPNKVYTYDEKINQITYTFMKKKNGISYWKAKNQGINDKGKIEWTDTYTFRQRETKNGLQWELTGEPKKNYFYLAYPIEKGKTFLNWNGTPTKIISTNATVKIKAGTFKNVVITKTNDKHSGIQTKCYYAPGYGLIKAGHTTNPKDPYETELELEKVTNKK
ncbi:MAG TPA: hypothetical protein VNU45_01075 [Rummeliibacillus sp.]|nr:hypothetical protein [Rummeliibacillus sp.]